MAKACGCGKCCLVTSGIVGALLAAAGIAFLHYFPIIYNNVVKREVILTNNSTGFQNWANPPASIYVEFYVWNLENPQEVQNGAKPNVTQKGPYVYSREKRPKVNITDDVNGTISYAAPQTFHFDPERSVGDPMNDTFTMLNVPCLAVLNQLLYLGSISRIAVEVILEAHHTEIYMTRTVHEFIWGYVDPVLTDLKTIGVVPTDVFGIYAGKNGSSNGVYAVYTGETDYMLTNTIKTWNGNATLPFWSDKYANMINGTDGTYNHPFITKDDAMYFFSSDICRSIFALYLEDSNVRGLPTMRFAPPSYLFANYTIYPPNLGFCTPADPTGGTCYPGGLLNVSQCQFGAPIFMSSPHFLYADQSVLDMVNGVHPVEELHMTYFDLEPHTGGPLNASKKLQINAHMRSYNYSLFSKYKNVREAYLPLAWINEYGSITPESAAELRKQLLLTLQIGTYAPWGAVGLGALVILISLISFAVMQCKQSDSKSLNVNADETTGLLNGQTS